MFGFVFLVLEKKFAYRLEIWPLNDIVQQGAMDCAKTNAEVLFFEYYRHVLEDAVCNVLQLVLL